ncbi:hypothetical protein ACHAQD_002540 [Fusarium lateritium]
MSLGSLPVELLTNLGGFCGYTQLASLACVNHTFHAIFNPILYKLNAADVPQKSCLNWAVEHDLLSTLKLAITYGASINNTSTEDEEQASIRRLFGTWWADRGIIYASVLHRAILKKRSDIVRWLLDNNARLDALTYQLCKCDRNDVIIPWYPLHFAVRHSNDEILCLLLERGAFYSAEDVAGLCCAVKSGALSAVEILTRQDSFDPNYRDSSHMTALHWVAECERLNTAVAITERLVQCNVPVNVLDTDGRTALYYLIFLAMMEPATILLRHGADPTLDDNNNRGVDLLTHCFRETDKWEIHEISRIDPSEAEAVVERGLEVAKLLIKGGVDVNRRVGHGAAPFSRPLFWALTETRDVRCVQLVLDAGADISSAVVENCHTKSESLLRYFFDLFSDKQESDAYLSESLSYADPRQYKESVCLLLEKGARIDAVGDEYSALSKACDLERKKGALTLLVESATCRNTELEHVAKLRERYKADELVFKLLDGFYHQLEAEMRTGD